MTADPRTRMDTKNIGNAFRNTDYEEEIERLKRSLFSSGDSTTNGLWTTAPGPAVGYAAAGWLTLKPGPIFTSPASVFTANLDSSITIAEAGWYDFSANIVPSASVTVSLAISTGLAGAGTLIAVASETAVPNGATACAGSAYLAAGTKVSASAWASGATNIVLQNFSIVKLGGAKGDAGAPGPPGQTGSGGDLTYTHTQGALSATWVVSHTLNKRPSVTVIDTGNNVVLANVHYDSDSQVTITFDNATSGKVYLN